MTIRYKLTNVKRQALEREGYIYQQIWDCEIRKLLQSNEELKSFAKKLEEEDFFQARLDPRDTFFGGRTNASTLY